MSINNIIAENIITTNLTVTNLAVTNINGRPVNHGNIDDCNYNPNDCNGCNDCNTNYGDCGHSNCSGSYKTFVIDHPLNILEEDKSKEKYLVHACLEGPEVGVYYRGTGEITNNRFTIIQLPNYVSSLAYNFTIQLTTIYNKDLDNDDEFHDLLERNYKAGKVIDNSFNVYGRNGEFYWTVYGERSAIQVDPLKSNTSINGHGPYRWI
jgi:hypothetical protein